MLVDQLQLSQEQSSNYSTQSVSSSKKNTFLVMFLSNKNGSTMAMQMAGNSQGVGWFRSHPLGTHTKSASTWRSIQPIQPALHLDRKK